MNQKGFAPILIVILIALVVGGYLLYQNLTKPTPPPTIQQCGQEGGDVPGIPCPSGYVCQPVENTADSAICVKK